MDPPAPETGMKRCLLQSAFNLQGRLEEIWKPIS